MKIEAGCRAVIVNSHAGNNGIVVTVIKKLGEVKRFSRLNGDRWEVDTYLKTVNNEGIQINHLGESQLKRINDDLRKVVSWDALASIYTPPLREVVDGV